MPRKLTNGVAIGVVTGGYRFDGASEFKHSRTVERKEESLPRDTFKQARPDLDFVQNRMS